MAARGSACLTRGLPRRSRCLPMRLRRRAPDEVVALLCYSAVQPALVGPANVVWSSLPPPLHLLGMHNSIARCNDFLRLCWSPDLACLQHMYITVGGSASPVGASLGPYGSPGASGVRSVMRPLVHTSLPPAPQVWRSLMSLCAPLVPGQVYCAVLTESCWLLRTLGP